jgi:hypothetical protein
VIQPLPPNKPRGVPRVERRVSRCSGLLQTFGGLGKRLDSAEAAVALSRVRVRLALRIVRLAQDIECFDDLCDCFRAVGLCRGFGHH